VIVPMKGKPRILFLSKAMKNVFVDEPFTQSGIDIS
jgi:hypothetical protein